MIVGGYTLDLYCEHVGPRENGSLTDAAGHRYDEFPRQFYAETGSECRAEARRRGWRLDLKEGRAICPRCVKAGRK